MKKYLIYIFYSVLLISCNLVKESKIVDNDVPFESKIPLSNNGDILLLSTPKDWNSYKINEPIGLFIQNLSKKDITYNIKDIQLYYLDDSGKWIEVKNKAIYVGGDNVVVGSSTSSDILTTKGEFVDPDINHDKSTYVKVIIVGNYLMTDGSIGEQVATFIDVYLNL